MISVNLRRFIFLGFLPCLWFALVLGIGTEMAMPTGIVTIQTAQFSRLDSSGKIQASTEQVNLPHSWDQTGQLDDQTFNKHASNRGRYLLELDLKDIPADPWAILIPKLGNAYQLDINGQTLRTKGYPDTRVFDYSDEPQYTAIPTNVWKRGRNQIVVHISARAYSGAGLSPVFVGQQGLLELPQQTLYARTVVVSWFVVGICFFSSVLALVFWWEARESVYLWFGLACLVWAVRIAAVQWTHFDIAVPAMRGILRDGLYIVFTCLIAQFTFEAIHLKLSWMPRALLITGILVFTGWACVHVFGLNGIRLFLQAAVLLMTLAATSLALIQCYRYPETSNLVLGTLALFCVITGVRDYVMVALLHRSWNYSGLTRLVVVLYVVGMLILLLQRYLASMKVLKELNQTLEIRVADHQEKLELAYAAMSEEAARHAADKERVRIMREIHDGLGHQLVQAMQLLAQHKTGDMNSLRQPLHEILEDSMTELRLAVASFSSDVGDFNTILGNFRERLEPFLKRTGISIFWNIEMYQGQILLDAPAVSHLYRILQEAMTNIMKHSRATEVVFWSAYDRTEKQMQLRIIDNGKVDEMCLPANRQGAGHGVLSMQARARQLGGRLDLEFTSHGSAVNLVFPVSIQMILND